MVFQAIGSALSAISDIASIGVDSAYVAQASNTGSIDAYIQGANASTDASQLHRDYVDGPPSTPSLVAPGISSSSISSVSLVCLGILVVMIL